MRRLAISALAACGATMAATLPAQVAAPPVTIASLADMPNTKVRYYDVAGADVGEINRSIARQRPRSDDGQSVPARTDWAVRAEFDRTITDGQCRVTAARASFTASADLPRLAEGSRIDKPTRERWQNYVSQLEQGSLATLAYVYQNLGTVEQAMLASPCENAKAVAAAAIERLRVQTDRLDAEREKRLTRQNESLAEFRPTDVRAAQVDCRDLDATGSRLRSFRICLPAREWERMQNDSEEYALSVQNSFSKRDGF